MKALGEQNTELKTVFDYLAPFKSYDQKTAKLRARANARPHTSNISIGHNI